jgi:preprotein translocase subunit SecE
MLMEKYKWGQGKNTRLYGGLAVGVMAAIGCWRLYDNLGANLNTAEPLWLWVSILVPLAVMAIMGAFLYWLVNRPTVADFLISAEGELKKVSFSSKQEIAVSTFVVIVVMLAIAFMLGAADFCFDLFFTNVIGI